MEELNVSSARKLGLIALTLVALVALLIAACGDDDDDSGGNGADLTALEEQVTKAQVLAAMTVFRVEAIHDLDDSAQKAAEIEAGWSGQVDRMHIAMMSVTWPEDLKADADSLTAALGDLADAIEADDLEAVKGASGEAHAQWHDFEHETGTYLSGEAHAEDAGHEAVATDAAEGDGHGEEETSGS
jgi:hypothetical protein